MQLNGRSIDDRSIEIDGIGRWITDDRYHLFDAFINYAEWDDGSPLSEDDLEQLNMSDSAVEWIAKRQVN